MAPSKNTVRPRRTSTCRKRLEGEAILTYLVRDLVMEPGEVMIVSPGAGSSNTELHDEATPGTNLTDAEWYFHHVDAVTTI